MKKFWNDDDAAKAKAWHDRALTGAKIEAEARRKAALSGLRWNEIDEAAQERYRFLVREDVQWRKLHGVPD